MTVTEIDKTPINLKWAQRKMSEFLPPTKKDEGWIPQLIKTLWEFSNTYLEAEEITAGRIHFDAEASYDQLAKDMRCNRATAKWRCEQLHERYPLVLDWNRGKYSCHFKIRLERGMGVPIDTRPGIKRSLEEINALLGNPEALAAYMEDFKDEED